jgi:hypothetical protein
MSNVTQHMTTENRTTVNYIVSQVSKSPKGLLKISVVGSIPTLKEVLLN